jgi:hypothetical protein
MKKCIILVLTLFLFNCPDENCYPNNYPNITSYEINITNTTNTGINIDDPLEEIDIEELERQTSALEECLGVTIDRNCLLVKVAPDWYISPCSGNQLFPCNINIQECLDKGLTLEDLEECPCNCRARIQDNNIIIVTPDLLIYRGELARMVLGVNNPWPRYSHCLQD